MMRTAITAIPILLLVILPAGCEKSYQDNSSSVLLVADESPDVWATPPEPDLAGSAQTGQNAASNRQAAVVFVAFAATPDDVVNRMLKMAKVTKDDVVYDLGCGDGRIVVTAAKEYGCKAVGYDLDRLRVQEARTKVQKNRVAHLVRIEQKDISKVDLRPATVVTLYLGTELNGRLIPQLSQLPPGARIVSHDFGLGDIPPDEIVEMTSRTDARVHKVYLWICPLTPE